MILKWLDDEYNEVVANVKMVNKSDIMPLYDTHIKSFECSDGGWIEIWNSCGKLVGYKED